LDLVKAGFLDVRTDLGVVEGLGVITNWV